MTETTISEDYRQELLAYRNQLADIENTSQQQYDKYIMSLAGGAFGLSFTFANNFVGESPNLTGLLVAAWISWGLTIAFGLFSFYASVLAARRLRAEVDRVLVSGAAGQLLPGASPDWASGLTHLLNVGAGVLFVVGIAALSLFVLFNYS